MGAELADEAAVAKLRRVHVAGVAMVTLASPISIGVVQALASLGFTPVLHLSGRKNQQIGTLEQVRSPDRRYVIGKITRQVGVTRPAIGQGQRLHFKSFKLVILATTAIVSVALTGCDTTQQMALSLNPENVMKIHVGMPSNKILEMFGTPNSVRQSVCGASVGKPWTCTTWGYGEIPEWASFTFSGDSGSLVLNDFNIRRK